MDLEKQIKIWERQLNWNKIIKAIEKLGPEDQTPELKLELASAYINKTKGDWKQRKTMEKALMLLWPIEEDFEDDFVWYFNVGNALYNLDRWSEAYPNFGMALECGSIPRQGKEFTKMLMLECDKKTLKPEFKQPFESRVKQAWSEFLKNESEFRRRLLSSKKPLWEVTSEIENIFGQALYDVSVSLEPEEGKIEVNFTLTTSVLQLYEIQYLIDRAPASIAKNWSFNIGYPVSDPKNALTEGMKDNIKGDGLELIGEEDGVFTFDAYSAPIENSDEDEEVSEEEFDEFDDEELEYLEDWVNDIVGKVPFLKYFRIEKLIEDAKGKKIIPLIDLPKFLQEKGIDIRESSRALLDKTITYTRTPDEELDQREYRQDIEWGWTKCVKVLQDYEKGDSEEVEDLERDGVALGCLFYRTDTFKGPNREKDLEDFRETLKKQLTEIAGKDTFEIMGEAHGTNFDYLDLLLWDSIKVLATAFVIFKHTDVSFSGYHPLRKRCGCARMTGENTLIPYRRPGSDKLVNPRKKERATQSLVPEKDDQDEDNNPLLSSFWKPKNTIH